MTMLRWITLALRQIVLRPALFNALRRNEQAAAQLDAAVREVMRK
ncbi:MAG: hypothetical protein AAFO80_10260 [Pseudomonadota bacterium]